LADYNASYTTPADYASEMVTALSNMGITSTVYGGTTVTLTLPEGANSAFAIIGFDSPAYKTDINGAVSPDDEEQQ
jgi:hypothetical protein